MMAALRARFGAAFHVFDLSLNESSDPWRLLGDVAVFVAPHGAGLANLFHLPREAIVVEIAYTGEHAMRFPHNYYFEWAHRCGLTHAIALADGEYDSEMTVNITHLLRVVAAVIRQSEVHAALGCGSRTQ